MKEFVMIMKGTQSTVGWEDYIAKLSASGFFRGGSAFGGGRCFSKQSKGAGQSCVATGYMRFEAETIEQIEALVPGNPVFESGDEVELHELVFG